jgi:hypothetical protein
MIGSIQLAGSRKSVPSDPRESSRVRISDFTSIRPPMGGRNPRIPARFARPNAGSPKDPEDARKKEVPKPPKTLARFARRNVEFPSSSSHFGQKEVSHSPRYPARLARASRRPSCARQPSNRVLYTPKECLSSVINLASAQK